MTGSSSESALRNSPATDSPTESVLRGSSLNVSVSKPAPQRSMWSRARQIILGRARDVRDPSLHHKISLIAFFAWVGLGADGLSSSAYGPEEAYRALGDHLYLAIFLALATSGTVFILSYAYSRIIEHFPTGGGGYIVATKLLGRQAGVVSGCALLVDYILTITVSIAGGGDALFSLLPVSIHALKLPVEFGAIFVLILLNLRGVKESVAALTPIFLAFVITHAILIFGAIAVHAGDIPAAAGEVRSGIGQGLSTFGMWGLFLIFARAYSLGGGTFTGIEAVSNGVAVLREPKVETGKRTMAYMGASLALTASGILICYMLLHVQPVEGKTLNAVLADRFAGAFHIGHVPVGAWFVMLTVFSEAILLLVAAQTGFIDGPRVMANMAGDSWLPRRFASLSDRMTMQNGILLIGLSALALLAFTRGNIDIIVVMYSMNVFLTFSLSETGMVRFWIKHRDSEPLWKRNLSIHSTGLVLCITILAVMVKEKFTQGAWVTMVITSTCIALCFLIKAHYNRVGQRVIELKKNLSRQPVVMEPGEAVSNGASNHAHTAAILVGAFDGIGTHLFSNVMQLFPHYKSVVFISIGKVDSDFFRQDKHVQELEERTQKNLDQYVELSERLGISATSVYAIGTDVVDEATRLCLEVGKAHPRAIFFAGELLFESPAWYHRFLHNELSYAIQRQIRFAGHSMLILPMLLQNGREKTAPTPAPVEAIG